MLKYSKTRIIILIVIIIVLWISFTVKECSDKSRAVKVMEKTIEKTTESITEAANKFASSFSEISFDYTAPDTLMITGAFTSINIEESDKVFIRSKSYDQTLEEGDVYTFKLQNDEDITIGIPSYLMVNVKLQTGDINLEYYHGRNLTLQTGSGDIVLNSVENEGTLSLIANTGDIESGNLIADSLTIKSATGDVTLVNTSLAEDLIINMATGDIEIDEINASNIQIDLSLGDVDLYTFSSLDEYEIQLKTDTGSWKLGEKSGNGTYEGGHGPKKINITTSLGDIRVNS